MSEQFLPERWTEFCEPCKKRDKQTVAMGYCKQCEQAQCETCLRAHEVFDFLSDHEIVQADKATEVKGASWVPIKSTVDLNGLDTCERHEKEFEFYCVDHDTVLCSVCAVEVHRQCREVNGLSTQIKKSKPDHNNVISVLKDVQTRALSVIERVNATRTNMRTQVDDIPVEIDKMKEKLVQAFEELKYKLVKEAGQHENHITLELDNTKNQCDEILKSVRNMTKLMDNLATEGTPEQLFIVSNVVSKKYINDIDIQEKKNTSVNFGIQYYHALNVLLKKEVNLGELVVKQQTSLTHGETAFKTGSKPASLVLKTRINEDAAEDYYEKEPLNTGVAFLPDGRLVVVDNANAKCYVMDERLKKLGMYQFQMTPKGVVVISATDVVISGGSEDKKTLHFMFVSHDHKISVTRTIKCSARYFSLSLMNDETLIAGAIDNKRAVRMVSLTGHESNLDDFPKKAFSIDYSRCTYLRKENVLVFTDRSAHAVSIYDVNGTKCALRCMVKHKDIKEPGTACAGPDDTIFVCCISTHCIVQLSLMGEVLTTIKVSMKHPLALCMNQNETKLVLSNSCIGARKLHLYSIQ